MSVFFSCIRQEIRVKSYFKCVQCYHELNLNDSTAYRSKKQTIDDNYILKEPDICYFYYRMKYILLYVS